MAPQIKCLVWATDIDVLAPDHIVERRDGYWAVHSPSNPTFWWGNFLLFDHAPTPGDGAGWDALFVQEFGERPDVRHRTLAWDCVDGQRGAAEQELVPRGYELETTSGLIARPAMLKEHPRANRDAAVRALDPDGDDDLWAAVIDAQMAGAVEDGRDVEGEQHLTFVQRRQQDLRETFRRGHGGWYVALLDGAVAGSLGIVVTETRARYQVVETVPEFRRQGVARRLVLDAARDACSKHAIDHFVIAADPDYHAIGIYEGLGFERVELVVGAMRKPGRP
jgi:ribosomal protein S18 acetylase RimI-like enzyme